MLLSAIQERPPITEHIRGLIKTATDDEKFRSLEYAINNKSKALLRLLVKNGIDINLQDFAGQTVLHKCILSNNLAFAQETVALGAREETKDFSYETPLNIALREKNTEAIRFLLGKPNLPLSEIKQMPGYGVIDDVNYAQNEINNKLIDFLVFQGKSEKEARTIFLDNEGNCNGWSFLVQYYIGLESEEEFYDILKCISRWDPKKQPDPFDVRLSDFKDVPEKLVKKYRSLGKLMNFTINDLAWFQHAQILASETNIKQQERMKQWPAIIGPHEKIELKNIFNLSGKSCSTVEDIKTQLEFARRWPNSWIDIDVYREKGDPHKQKGHTISVYITPSGKFKFYDSNRKKRLPEIESAETVSNMIKYCLREATIVSNFNLYRFYPKTEQIPEVVAPEQQVADDQYANEKSLALLSNLAVSGEIDLVKHVLQHGGLQLVTAKNRELINYLSRLAIIKNDPELKTLLEDHGIAFTNKMFEDSATIALSQCEVKSFIDIVKANGELKSALIDKRNEDEFAALHLAVEQNELPDVIDLLRLGADKELKRDHETPLYMAVRLEQLKIAKLLIQNQADI
ncbi:MAG: ankyrin repeat domain-containing protein, partial [Candidatus Berkiella sp.]